MEPHLILHSAINKGALVLMESRGVGRGGTMMTEAMITKMTTTVSS